MTNKPKPEGNDSPSKPKEGWEEGALRTFEANFLDGDKIDDCGGATFTAIGAFDVYNFAYERGKKRKLSDELEWIESARAEATHEAITKAIAAIEEIRNRWANEWSAEAHLKTRVVDDILSALKSFLPKETNSQEE